MVEDPRMLQANERTLLAWLRTGVSLITFGFVISRTSLWLRRSESSSVTHGENLIGAAFVLLGAISEAIGVVRYLRIRRALLERRPVHVGAAEIVGIGVAVSLFGLVLCVYAFL
jgi:putative membrane protein